MRLPDCLPGCLPDRRPAARPLRRTRPRGTGRAGRAVLRWLGASLAVLLAGLGAVHAQTQPQTQTQPQPKPPAAAPTRVPDTIEQRAAACIACHGREGSSVNAIYFPRLAGKPEVYLYNQLRSFRDGRRHHTEMVYMVRHLSDDYLRELARYFSQLRLPYLPPAPAGDVSDAVLERGRALALDGDAARGIPACAQCHGERLTGVLPGIPALVGLPRLYIASQLGDWLTDSRHALPPDCMTEVGRKLTPSDITAVASWLATRPVPADGQPAPAPTRPLPLACSGMNP